MTTAAPPEKMTNAQIANEAENLARDHDNEFPITARILREAARRMSAPAPAAPRVGDVLRRALDVVDLFAEWERRQGTLAMITPPERAVICEIISHAVVEGMNFRQLQMDLEIALSAPPAASADEREDRVQVADEMRSYFYEDAAECSPHKYAEFLQCADIALGYRKLAPAQSVGQSAAQGVGEFAAELVKWCEKQGAHYMTGGPSRAAYNEMIVYIHVRLSALPKGQEHE